MDFKGSAYKMFYTNWFICALSPSLWEKYKQDLAFALGEDVLSEFMAWEIFNYFVLGLLQLTFLGVHLISTIFVQETGNVVIIIIIIISPFLKKINIYEMSVIPLWS